MEPNLAFGFGCDKQLHSERDERYLNMTGPIGTSQSTPRGQLHPMIEIRGSTVKMYEVVIGEEDKTFSVEEWVG
jgi:hypothetical protein